MFRLILLFICVIMATCEKQQTQKRPFKGFEYFHSNTWSTAFSIKFTETDTVYVRQHFASMKYSNTDTTIKRNTSYVGRLSQQQNATLDSFIQGMDFYKYDSSYKEQGLEDGSTFRFYIYSDSLIKFVHIYGDSAPTELLRFVRWIADVKSSLRLIEVDSLIDFEHANDWLLPPVDVDYRKFIPPTVEH